MTDRHNRLAEVVDIMRSIWAENRDERFAGFPRPAQEPPIIVGVNSMALAIRAGQITDGVNTRFNHPDRGVLLAAARDASVGLSLRIWATVVPWAFAIPESVSPDLAFTFSAIMESLRISNRHQVICCQL